MRVGPMTPIVPGAGAVVVGRRDEAERPQARIEMLGADHDGQAGAVDVLVQQSDQPLLLLDHLQQRVHRLERQAVVLAEQRRGAVDVEHVIVGQIGRTSRRPAASRALISSS